MEHWYIFGSRAQRPPTLVVLTRDERAWRARSTDVDYQHDYPVTQSLEDVVEWIRKDLARDLVAQNREDALQLLSDGCMRDVTNSEPTPRMGFLAPGEAATVEDAAERVLAHLERGW